MFGKRAALVGLVTSGFVASAVAVASADSGSGFTSVLIGRGQSDHSFGIQQRKGNDVVTAQNTFASGGFSGWHSHPGIVVVVVQSGEAAVTATTFFNVPHGGSNRIDRTNPGDCPA